MDIKDFILSNCFRQNDTLRSEISNVRWWSSKNFLDQYHYIKDVTSFLNDGVSWQERIYCILTDIDTNSRKTCKCGNAVKWDPCKSRYTYFCSPKCSSLYTVKKRKDSSLAKYGTSNPAQTDIVKSTIKQTFLKFDGGHPLRDPSVKRQLKETCNEIYGADSPLQSPLVLAKIKQKIIKEYGVEFALQNPESLQKQKATTLEKYGVENFNQRHLRKDSIELAKSFNNETELDEFFNLGYSISHTYKIVKSKGVVLEKMRSIAEIAILNFLESSLGRKLESNVMIDGKEFDIFDPILHIAVEHNGVYWHSEDNGKDKNYHKNKTLIANRHNIRLIHIFSSEWENNKDIVKSRLLNIFGITPNKLYARKCNIRQLKSKEEKLFFDANHIQGYVASKISYGLFIDNLLVSAISFSSPRFNKKYDWELLRFASLLNYSVVGGFSRLLSFFGNNNTGSVITYADVRWSTGNVYELNGFTLVGESAPGYYYTKNGSLESRVKYQKHKLKKFVDEYADNLTESEIMNNLGYSRIWDCGNFIFDLIIDK